MIISKRNIYVFLCRWVVHDLFVFRCSVWFLDYVTRHLELVELFAAPLDELRGSSSPKLLQLGTPHNQTCRRLRSMSHLISIILSRWTSFGNLPCHLGSIWVGLSEHVWKNNKQNTTRGFSIPFPEQNHHDLGPWGNVCNHKEAGERVPLHAAACEQGPISWKTPWAEEQVQMRERMLTMYQKH